MKINQQLLIITIFLLVIRNYLISQNSFEYSYSSDYFNMPIHIIETKDKEYIIGIAPLDSNFYQNFFSILKINELGELQKVKNFTNIENVYVNDMLINSDSTFLCLGNYYSHADSNDFIVLCINYELELLWRKEYKNYGRSIGYIRRNKNNSGNIIFSAMSNIYNFKNSNLSNILLEDIVNKDIDYGIVLYELNNNGDSILAKQYNDDYIESYHIVEKPDRTGYFLFGFTNFFDFLPANNFITELDYNFNPVQENVVPLVQGLTLRTNARNLGDSKIIYTGMDFYQNGQRFETITIVDNELEPIANQQIILTDEDTNVNCTHQYNLDFVDENNIYVSAIYNFKDIPYQFEPSWILLTNLDSMLNIRWQKFYGGDAFYFPWSILATSDGGCIVLGYRWDYDIQDYFRNEIFVLKVDSMGNLTTIYGPEIIAEDVKVFPNPGTDILNLSLSPNMEADRFELYDLSGKLILTENIMEHFITINTSSIKQGLYFYRLYSPNKLIAKGKWLKQ